MFAKDRVRLQKYQATQVFYGWQHRIRRFHPRAIQENSNVSVTVVKYLGDEQETQRKLRDTLRQAHADAFARREQPQLEHIVQKQVPYLDAFIEEVLRLAEPARGISRETLCDMPILGHVVPKGTMIVFSLSGPTFQERGTPVAESVRSESSQKHYSDRIGDWADSNFPANEFRPERWLRPSGDEKGEMVFDSQAGPLLAFSTGPRGCWGKRLAYMELKLVTTLLLWNFVFQRLPSELHDWEVKDDLFVKPKHCRVKLGSAWDAPSV
jgi:cytochrome P450